MFQSMKNIFAPDPELNEKTLDECIKRAMRDFGFEGEVLDSHYFMDDMGMDSLDLVELVMIVEEAFNIEINDDGMNKVQTVKQFKQHVLPQLSKL